MNAHIRANDLRIGAHAVIGNERVSLLDEIEALDRDRNAAPGKSEPGKTK
jgi:hypothetical protein